MKNKKRTFFKVLFLQKSKAIAAVAITPTAQITVQVAAATVVTAITTVAAITIAVFFAFL